MSVGVYFAPLAIAAGRNCLKLFSAGVLDGRVVIKWTSGLPLLNNSCLMHGRNEAARVWEKQRSLGEEANERKDERGRALESNWMLVSCALCYSTWGGMNKEDCEWSTKKGLLLLPLVIKFRLGLPRKVPQPYLKWMALPKFVSCASRNEDYIHYIIWKPHNNHFYLYKMS